MFGKKNDKELSRHYAQPQSPKKKLSVKNIIIGVIVLFILVGVLSQCGGNSKSSASSTASSAISSTVSEPSKASSELTSDSIKDALKNDNVPNLDEVKFDGETVTIIVYDKTILTAGTYLQQNQPHSAKAFKCAFGLSNNINKVIYQSDVDVNDAYGNSSRVTAQTNTMTKDDADKISNWDAFECESPSQYYSVVNFELAPESKISGIHAAWAKIYN